jgi:acetyltransferase-like isoleucine patch superfamily enzyme
LDDAKIMKIRTRLTEFLKTDKKLFSFQIDCNISERIKFIYAIIFPGFEKQRFYFRFLIARIAQIIDFSPIKVFLYRLIGIKIGKGVFISPDVFIDPHFPTLIELGDYCILGWGARLFAHESSGTKYRLGRIRIGEGTVIGAYSTIRSGTRIAKMQEIPFGSIVYKDVAKDVVKDEVKNIPRDIPRDMPRDILKGNPKKEN